MRFLQHNLVSEMRNWIQETPNIRYFGVDFKGTHLNRLRVKSIASSKYYEALQTE